MFSKYIYKFSIKEIYKSGQTANKPYSNCLREYLRSNIFKVFSEYCEFTQKIFCIAQKWKTDFGPYFEMKYQMSGKCKNSACD